MAMLTSQERMRSEQCTTLSGGFLAVKQLANPNIYGVLLSIATLNIFKEGMWMKMLAPYTLFLAESRNANGLTKLGAHSTDIVGATISLYGLTRAVVSVVASALINRLGADTVFVITGWFGLMGVAINCFSLWLGRIRGVFLLAFVWGMFDGLWKSCLEAIWLSSTVQSKREAVNWARQVLSVCTKALGPILALLCYQYYGNSWQINDMRDVMLLGTLLTSLPVMECFCFHKKNEVRQDVNLCDVRELQFQTARIVPRNLTKADFTDKGQDGPIKLSYPLRDTDKTLGHDSGLTPGSKRKKTMGRLRILTPDLQESNLILGKQFPCRFRDVASTEKICVVHFEDPSREPTRVGIVSIAIFLRRDKTVDTQASKLAFSLYPELEKGDGTASRGAWPSDLSKTPSASTPADGRSSSLTSSSLGLNERLLPPQPSSMSRESSQMSQPPGLMSRENSLTSQQPALQSRDVSFFSRQPSLSSRESSSLDRPKDLRWVPATPSHEVMFKELRSSQQKRGKDLYTPNIFAANVIILCDMLNALGSGLSLRFIDLFLIQRYALSPASILLIAFLECCCGAFLTPAAHKMMLKSRSRGYHAKSAVLLLWGLSLLFLGILCVPGVPLAAVVPSVVLMKSTNSCTAAYLRAKLVSYLSHDRLPMYMVWDSLNDASQGGIAIIGAMLIRAGGYPLCFCCTFVFMFVRFCIYGAFTAKKLQISEERRRNPSEVGEADVEQLDNPEDTPHEWQHSEDQDFNLDLPTPLQFHHRKSHVEHETDVEEAEYADVHSHLAPHSRISKRCETIAEE